MKKTILLITMILAIKLLSFSAIAEPIKRQIYVGVDSCKIISEQQREIYYSVFEQNASEKANYLYSDKFIIIDVEKEKNNHFNASLYLLSFVVGIIIIIMFSLIQYNFKKKLL